MVSLQVKKMMVASVVVCGMTAVRAETLGWWHFDEEAPGAVTSDQTAFVNSAHPEHGTGAAKALAGTSDTGGIYPTYGKPSAHTLIYDPVTDTVWTNRSALSLRVEATGDKTSNGGAMMISKDTFFQPESVTAEAFICTTGGVINTFWPIFSYCPDNWQTGETWCLYMTANGKIEVRYRTKNNTSPVVSGTGGQGKAVLTDGLWHHVALAYDSATAKLTVYVDYNENWSCTTAGGALHYGTSAKDTICLGGYYSGIDGRKFNGRIDEFRISSVALSPDKFLRRRSALGAGSAVDERTMVYLPFENSDVGTVLDDSLNVVWDSSISAYLKDYSGTVTSFDSDVPADAVRGSFGTVAVDANEGALLSVTNGADGAGTVVTATSQNYFDDDLTVECYFKTAGTVVSAIRQTIYSFNDNFKLMFLEGDLYFSFYSWDTGTSVWHGGPMGMGYDDGKWHHCAAVYKKAEQQIRIYIDGKYLASWTAKIREGNYYPLTVGANSGSSQRFHGHVDSFRVTRGRLHPHEFLNAVSSDELPDPSDEGVMFRTSFDGDYSADPFPSVLPVGVGSARTGGSVPQLSSVARAPELYSFGKSAGIVRPDTGSLYLNGSQVGYSCVQSLGEYSQTIEFFLKLERFDSGAGLVRMTYASQAGGSTPFVYLYHHNTSGKLYAVTASGDGSSQNYRDMGIRASDLSDNRWHHLALTVEADPAENTTTYVLYVDSVKKGESVGTSIPYSPDNKDRSLIFGYSATEGAQVKGYIDEFRITKGILPPERFMAKVPTGLIMLFK